MITALFYGVYAMFIGMIAQFATKISDNLPAGIDAYISNTTTTLETKLNLVYNFLPAPTSLFFILKITIILVLGYLGLRTTIFIINKVRGSGGNI